MTLRQKLLLAQSPLALALLLLGLTSVRTVGELGRSGQRILQDNYRSVLAAQRMKEAVERLDSSLLKQLAGQQQGAGAQAAQVQVARFELELQGQEANITEAGEADATVQLRKVWVACREGLARFGPLDPAAQRELYFAELAPRFEAVRGAADRILELNQDAMVHKSALARRLAERNDTLLIATTVGALLLGLFASITLTSRVLRPLARLSSTVRLIGEGDLDARAKLSGQDEIAQVGLELDAMADKLRNYRSSSLGELLEAQQASQAAIDSLPDPVLVLGPQREVLNVNLAAEALLRLGPRGALGADGPLAALEPELRATVERLHKHIASGKGPYLPRGFDEAIRLSGADGERKVLPRGTPLYSEQGGIIGATIVLQDVTRLLLFDELKNDLVATVAHEFRTPLTSLRMAIHLCLEGIAGELSEKQQELLFTAREDCERLQRIVDDLLDLSRLQAGKVQLSLAPAAARTLVEAAVGQHEAAAREASVELVAKLFEPLPLLLVDAERLSLVLTNLIVNALRYSPRGSQVEVRAEEEPGGALVRFQVSDTGEGVPREYQSRIFEKFFRVPGTKGQGMGLGLYLSREIVQAHGGTMGVVSEPGEGSKFWFTLPAGPAKG